MITIKQSMLETYLAAYKKREILVWSGFAAIILLTAYLVYITHEAGIIPFAFVGLVIYMFKTIKRVEDTVPQEAVIQKTNRIMENRKPEIMKITGEVNWNELLQSGWTRLSTLKKTKEYGDVDRSNVYYSWEDTEKCRFVNISFPIDIPEHEIKVKITITTTNVIGKHNQKPKRPSGL